MWSQGAAERLLAREQHAEAAAQQHVDRGTVEAGVQRTDGERRRSAAGAADTAVGWTGRAVVAGGHDDEHVQCHRSGRRLGERTRAERGERLRHPDERDTGGVVCISVAVRIGGRLEPGDHLVGPGIDGHASGCVGLPPGHADGADRSSGRDSPQAAGAAVPGDDARELGSVPLGPPGDGWVRPCGRVASGIDDVDPGKEAATDVRMAEIDAGVEQGDRDPRAVEPRQHDALPMQPGGGDDVDHARLAPERRRVGRPHRVDAGDERIALQQRDRVGVKGGREPVENAEVRMLGLHRRTTERKPREHDPLRRSGR